MVHTSCAQGRAQSLRGRESPCGTSEHPKSWTRTSGSPHQPRYGSSQTYSRCGPAPSVPPGRVQGCSGQRTSPPLRLSSRHSLVPCHYSFQVSEETTLGHLRNSCWEPQP